MELNLERPYYQDTGRRPFLFYAVMGVNAEELQVSRSRHRVEGLPEGLEISMFQRPEHNWFIDDLLGGPLGEHLKGRVPELYQKAKAAQNCLVIRGEVQQDSTLDYLRDAVGFVQAAVETGAAAVLDLQILELFSPEEWNKRVFSFQYHPFCHVTILLTHMGEGRFWLHTRGMRKLSRPDIGISGVPQEELDPAMAVVNQMVFYGAQGALFNRPGKLLLRTGEKCVIHPQLEGSLDDPDYNNEHYSLRWEDCKFETE